LKSLFIALQFLTIIPLRPSAKLEERDIAHSMSFFPLVGMMIGGFLIIINLITSGHLSPFIANALLLIGWVGITGAFHLYETSYIFSLICRGLIHQTRQFSGFINEVATRDAQLFMSFHIDGFADTVDGLCGGKNKEQILSIMKDSFIGTKGVMVDNESCSSSS